MDLKGKTAIITGASGRLGGAIARALAQVGCNCICHYNQNRQRAEELVEQIQETGVKASAIEADLAKPDRIKGFFDKAEQFGVPQILINSAAVFSRQPLEEVTFEEAQRVLNLNLTVSILTSQAFARMTKDKFDKAKTVVGKIINIADVGGIRPWAGYVLYCSSKELAPAVCVNAVAPGVVTWPSDFDESERQRQLSFIPAGRIAEPDEVTKAIIFLLENDYITGQVLNVDGGRCI